MHCDCSGQTALVTGASGALGACMAESLAAAGADLAIHYRSNRQAAEQVAEAVRAQGRRAMVVSAELSEQEPVQAMAKAIAGKLGMPSIIVANAVSQVHPWQPLLDEDPDDYLDQFRSCTLQVVHLAQAFFPAMQQRKYGRFVGISTECIMQNAVSQSAYVSGKRGMDGAIRSLAREVAADGITVNQVAPGYTISERDPAGDGDDAYTSRVPMGRRGTAQEVANAVVFLASPQASFITGTWLPVCGGNVLPAV
jgi:3-oxoacyl-[acyl-carrier protein] reductase